jgi:GAF domain-containing protein
MQLQMPKQPQRKSQENREPDENHHQFNRSTSLAKRRHSAYDLTKQAAAGFHLLSDHPTEIAPAEPLDALATMRAYTEATREIMRLVAESRHDEQPVFEAILQASAKLCRVNQCALFMVTEDPDTLILAASFGKTLQAFEVGVSTLSVDTPLTITQVYRENRTIHTEDMRDTELYRAGDPSRRMFVDGEGMRTQLAVPLYSGDTPMGGFTLSRQRVEAFSDAEIALVETFAAQAVIAIENARQFRELQTRLEHEAATRELLSVISQSRDDETPVFDFILENAARLCPSPMARLYLVEAERTHFAVAANWGENVPSIEPSFRMPLDSTSNLAKAINQGSTVHIADIRENAASPVQVQLAQREGLRTQLSVPLLKDGIAIGCLTLSRREVLPYEDEHIALLETFAAQAVIAIENARQFRELQTKLEREAASKEILHVISQSRDDEQPVFDVIVEAACRLCEANIGVFILGRAGDAAQRIVAHNGAAETTLALYRDGHYTMAPGESNAADSILQQRVIHVENLAETDHYLNGDPRFQSLVDDQGIRTILYVPLISQGEGIGCLNLFRPVIKAYTPSQIALVETFAAQAVIAIENARQFRELQTRLEREAATREILSVISRSRDDETPVFDVIVEHAARLCHASRGDLLIASEDKTQYALAASYGDEFGGASFTEMRPLDPERLSARALLENRIYHLHDVREGEAYKAGHPIARTIADVGGIRTILFVPLTVGGEAVGTIGLSRKEVAPFSDDEIALVQSFAAQAVIAIENVRQFRELQTRLEREAATREILEVISQSRDDELPVFNAVLESAARLCGSPNAVLHLVDSAREYSEWISSWGEPHRYFSPGEK